jgi:hypothetical protein
VAAMRDVPDVSGNAVLFGAQYDRFAKKIILWPKLRN